MRLPDGSRTNACRPAPATSGARDAPARGLDRRDRRIEVVDTQHVSAGGVGFGVGHLHEMNLIAAGFEPHAGKPEVGTLDLREPHDVRVEPNRRLDLLHADGDVVEPCCVHVAMVALMGEMIEFPSNGGTCPGYLATPASGSGPGIIVIQEWWGLVPHIKDVANRFAKEGFVALAPDLYHGKAASEPDEAGKFMMALSMAQAAKDLSGAVDEVASAAARPRTSAWSASAWAAGSRWCSRASGPTR